MGILLSQNQEIFQQPYWYGGFVDTNEIVGCAIHARTDGLVLSEMPDQAINMLVRNLNGKLGLSIEFWAQQEVHDNLPKTGI